MNSKQKSIQFRLNTLKRSRIELNALEERERTYSQLEMKTRSEEIQRRREDVIKLITSTEAIIKAIPDEFDRTIVSMYHVDCLPMDYVAEKTYCDRSTAWRHYTRGLDAIINTLNATEND